MPLPRFEKLPEERQHAILEQAAEEFAAHGPARASVNRILKAAGISKGAFYYYFHDKDDLWLAVMHRELAPFLPGDALARLDTGDWWAGVEALMLEMLATLAAAPRAAALMREAWRHPDPAVLDRLIAPMHAWWATLLRHGQARGVVRRDLPDALLVQASFGMGTAVDRWFAEHWEGLDPAELVDLSRATLGLFSDLLRPRAGATGPG